MRILSALLISPPQKIVSRNTRRQLLELAYRFSPIAALETPSVNDRLKTDFFALRKSRLLGLNLNISGCSKLFNGEKNLAVRLAKDLKIQGYLCRIAIAPTLGSAWALSRYGQQSLVVVEQEELIEELSLLPIAALRLTEKNEAALVELNIRQIGELLSVPRHELAERLDGNLLLSLDRALGIKEELISPVPLRNIISAKKLFPGPITQAKTLLFAVDNLLEELVKKLEQASKKAAQITLEIRPIDSPPTFRTLILHNPSLHKGPIWSLLKASLESVDIGAGIEALALSATHTSVIKAHFSSSVPGTNCKDSADYSPKNSLGELLDTLSSRLSKEQIRYLDCRKSHFPELAFCYQPLSSGLTSIEKLSILPNHTTHPEAVRPSLLFYHPRPIQAAVTLPDCPPLWLKWNSVTHQVAAAIGPERIAPQWWGRDDSLCRNRDYFRVQLAHGTWLWIFCELATKSWYLHGIWA